MSDDKIQTSDLLEETMKGLNKLYKDLPKFENNNKISLDNKICSTRVSLVKAFEHLSSLSEKLKCSPVDTFKSTIPDRCKSWNNTLKEEFRKLSDKYQPIFGKQLLPSSR